MSYNQACCLYCQSYRRDCILIEPFTHAPDKGLSLLRKPDTYRADDIVTHPLVSGSEHSMQLSWVKL